MLEQTEKGKEAGMILRKWNYEKHEYEPFEVPDEWNFVLHTYNMETLTTCPHCGKRFPFGEGYTSMEIHNEFGFGYSVCEECYEKEWKRRKQKELDGE